MNLPSFKFVLFSPDLAQKQSKMNFAIIIRVEVAPIPQALFPWKRKQQAWNTNACSIKDLFSNIKSHQSVL